MKIGDRTSSMSVRDLAPREEVEKLSLTFEGKWKARKEHSDDVELC